MSSNLCIVIYTLPIPPEREREREREREMEMGGGEGEVGGSNGSSLFRSEGAKWRAGYKLYASSITVGILCIWFYRATHVPSTEGRWAWLGLFGAELWFGFYWLITQSVRWNPIYYHTCKEKLHQRYTLLGTHFENNCQLCLCFHSNCQ